MTNGTGASPTGSQLQQLSYKMEGQDYAELHGKRVRLQFWVKSSVVGTFSVAFLNSASSRSYVAPFTINSGNTWEKKSIDLTLDSSGTWLFDQSIGLRLAFGMTVGSTFQTSNSATWQATSSLGLTGQTQWGATTGATVRFAQIAMYQIAADTNQDLPFKRAANSIQSEFAMCQRYFSKSYNADVAPASATTTGIVNIGFGANQANGISLSGSIRYPVEMRATPTIAFFTRAGGAGIQQYSNSGTLQTTVAGSSNGGGSAGFLANGGTSAGATGYLDFHWTADAEL